MRKIIAHITFGAKTALKIGSNQNDFFKDAPIQRDWNGLPMILGTSLAGILRKEFDEEFAHRIFGGKCNGQEVGSLLILSNALLLDENERVHEGVLLEKSDFLSIFDLLPNRDHNAISQRGVCENTAKYDEEVIFKGTRFKFSLEMPIGETTTNEETRRINIASEDDFFQILDTLCKDSIRVGGGGSKGFGEIEILRIDYDIFDTHTAAYQQYTSSLNNQALKQTYDIKTLKDKNFIHYELSLLPDDFFLFGSGYGDHEADKIGVYERVIVYEKTSKEPMKRLLIPASSIKGALSHRTCFYFNAYNNRFIGSPEPYKSVEEIFGAKKDKDTEGFKGRILIADLYLEPTKEQVFHHVHIDRFTGGAVNGALFQEKVYQNQEYLTLHIYLKKDLNPIALEAFEKALKDITTGLLPLGAASSKGHGFFSGTIKKDGEEL